MVVDVIRAVLHRIRNAPGSPGRSHRSARWFLGRSAGPAIRLETPGQRSQASFPDPRQRQEVHHRSRHRFQIRAHSHHSHPIQAPNANAFAERWVRTLRQECLDQLLILNEAHLRRVLQAFIDYYNTSRPHQGLAQQTPIPRHQPTFTGPIRRREVLGIINDYYRGTDPASHCPT